MIILITQGGVGGPEMGKTWLRNMCMLPNWNSQKDAQADDLTKIFFM